MIVQVDESNITDASKIHSESWKDSHKNICNTSFLKLHTVEHQKEYLRREIQAGKRVYMLVEESPVGIVSVYGGLIENLYVLPEKQRKGCGTKLLLFALQQCSDTPVLWILEINQKAHSLYFKYGFRETGKRNQLSDSLAEIEMERTIFE
jgi:GNAT superfamily N-acetyltransferase